MSRWRPSSRTAAGPLALLVLLALLVGLLVAPTTGPAEAAPTRAPTPGATTSETTPTTTSTTSTPAPTPTPTTPGGEPGSPPGSDPCDSRSEESPVDVEVTTLLPRAPTSTDEPFQVAGRLTNCGSEALDDLRVSLLVGNRIVSRSGLAEADEEPVLGRRQPATQDAAREALAPGESTTFDLRLSVGALGLGRANGVFPVAVQARAAYGRTSRLSSVGLASTFVPWFPDGPIAPTRIAWLLPLVDTPRRTPGGVLLDDGLEESLQAAQPAGRLQRLLASAQAGAAGGCDPLPAPVEDDEPPAPDVVPPDPPTCRGEPVPLTWAVDADLLGTVEAMVAPYSVLQGGQPVTLPASDRAARWLSAVREVAATGDVLALPYADPDVVALSRSESGVRDDVDQLRRLGQTEARRLLEVEQTLTSISFPPPGPIGADLDAVVPAGQGAAPPTVVVRGTSEPTDSTGRTPGARSTLASVTGPVTALTTDEALSRLVEPDPGAPSWQGARVAEQRWIAEVAMLAAERPSESRTFLIAPRRDADLVPEVASAIIADTGRLPWLCPVSLAALSTGTEQCASLPDEQGPQQAEERPAPRVGDRSPERPLAGLDPDLVEGLAMVRRRTDQLTDQVLLAGSDAAAETKARLLRARGRASSAAWREQPAQGRRMLDLLVDEVDGLRSQVRLLSEPVLLTGSSGTMRLTVENTLDQPVSIGVRLDDTTEARLSSQETDVREVPANQAVQLAVQVDARTSGRFVARARLIDASGEPFGQPVELAVRSTRYGRVALGVTGVAFAVLLVAAGARITRRALGRPGRARS